MAVSHVFSNTVGNWTGTVTVGNSDGNTQTIAATDLVRPQDWNSAHNQLLTISGNTAGQSTASGTNIVYHGDPGISLSLSTAANAATLEFGLTPILSSYVPHMPFSTGTQTHGGYGVTSGSVWFNPITVPVPIAFNALRMLLSYSAVTDTAAGTQSISSHWGLYTNNAGTLSLVSSNSISYVEVHQSISGTLSYPSSTNSAGYTTGSVAWSSTATGQSIVGTAFPRNVDLVFGNSMSLSPGIYWLGLFQRQSSSSRSVGISSGRYGVVIATQHTNANQIGVSALNTTNTSQRMPGFGVYTVTTTGPMPSAIPLTQIAHSITNMPLLSFTST